MPKAIDLTGQVFGRLLAIRETSEKRKGQYIWQCRCNCGGSVFRKECFVLSQRLRNGDTRSCGCMKTEAAKRVGHDRKISCPFSRARLLELYLSGESCNSLARMTGVSDGTTRLWLLEAEIPLRHPSQQNRLSAIRYRAKFLVGLKKGTARRAELIRTKQLPTIRHTLATRRKISQSQVKLYAARRAKQQAEREQSEAIERSLNGDTFK